MTTSSSNGHRKRLKDRFNKNPNDIYDYELLELFLFLVRDRIDTKSIAKDLLVRFGSIHDVIFGDEILNMTGIGPATLHLFKLVRELMIRMSKEKIAHKPVLSNLQQVVSYLSLVMSSKKYEHVRLLFLDVKQKLILDHEHTSGDVASVNLYIKEIVKKALILGAAGLLIAHNHPSGDPSPSRQDIDSTKGLKDILSKLGINLCDHIIIGHNKYSSMANMGLI